MTTSEIIKLVRVHGRERYRSGKANVRAKTAVSPESKAAQSAKALRHAQTANHTFRKIVDELSPYTKQ